MTRRKQPSKKLRELAARFCDGRAAAWCVCPVAPSHHGIVGAWLARRVFTDMPKVPDRSIGLMARTWAEAAAWLRSGEDLP